MQFRADLGRAGLSWISSLGIGLALSCPACVFALDEVRADAPESDSGSAAPDAAGQDAGADADASADMTAPDACWPATDPEYCALVGQECGQLEGVDACGQLHVIASCGACSDVAHCETGACVAYAFSWKTSAWSACSAACGGTYTRVVWCERDDGVHVVDALCTSPKPEAVGSCSAPCCTPSCAPHDACGSDGCTGSCGTTCSNTPYPRECRKGKCVWTAINAANASDSCDVQCYWGDSECVETSILTCDAFNSPQAKTCYCW